MQEPKRPSKQGNGFISKICFDEIELPNDAKAKGVVIDTGDADHDRRTAKELSWLHPREGTGHPCPGG